MCKFSEIKIKNLPFAMRMQIGRQKRAIEPLDLDGPMSIFVGPIVWNVTFYVNGKNKGIMHWRIGGGGVAMLARLLSVQFLSLSGKFLPNNTPRKILDPPPLCEKILDKGYICRIFPRLVEL